MHAPVATPHGDCPFEKTVLGFVLIAVEFVHGILRAIFLVPVVGDFRARRIGVFIGSGLILLVACIFVR